MARILVSGHGAASLIERLRTGLGEDWIVLDGPEIEGIGAVDALALHERHGAAVVTALGGAAHAVTAEAAAAFRHMLDSHGITRAFGGYLPIVALAIDPERARDPAGALRRAFLAEPPIGVRVGWVKRIAALFEAIPEVPARRRGSEPLALHADREDAWRVQREAKGAAPPTGVAVSPEEHVVPAETVREGGAPLWTGMAFAVLILAAVLGGMAVLSYGNGPVRTPATALTR
jgi:hypothetical protein